MDSQGIRRWPVRPSIVLATLGAALVMLVLMLALRNSDEASAVVRKHVKITIKCKVSVPSSEAPCRGTWSISGGIRDRGRVHLDSLSRGEGAYYAYYGGNYLAGHHGRLALYSDALGVSHRKRGCPASTNFFFHNVGSTRGYRGYRGTSDGSCSKVSFRRGTMYRTDVIRVVLSK